MDYHADRFQDHSLLVYDGPKLVAVLPANLDGTTLVSHGGLTFGGLQIGDSISARRVLEIFTAVREHLQDLGISSWLYKAVPHIYHRVPGEEDLYALFTLGAVLVRRDVSAAIRLDARLPYSKGRKAAVKAAQRAEIEVGPSDDFDGFMALQQGVLRARYDADPVHTGEELALLASRFPDEIALHTAKIGGRLVAGVVVYQTQIVAHSQYIAVNEEGRDAHALDKLIDDGLSACVEDLKRWWDFGTSNEPATGALNEALSRNKESYGARAVVYDQYLLDLAA
jgi:hypothetical protein